MGGEDATIAAVGITPLHIALWNGDLAQIDACLAAGGKTALEARDPRGNRALHLALKFAHRHSKSIVKRLLAAGARVRSRDRDGWKTVHHAIAAENEDMLRLLVQHEKAQAPGLLAQKIRDIAQRLAEVPDFTCAIHVEVSTWIPGVSRWLPSDTVRIWKRGRDLRFDITLIGFDHGAWQRGNLSFVLLGDPAGFYCLDHDDKSCTNLLSPGAELAAPELDKMAHFLLTTSIVTTEVDASSLSFERKRTWLTRSDAEEDVGCWARCKVYEMEGVVARLRMRKPQNKDHPPPTSAAGIDDSHLRAQAALAALQDMPAGAALDAVEVAIPPRAKHVVSLELLKGERVAWRFRVDACDVGFSVRFVPEANGDDTADEATTDVVPAARYGANGGHEHTGATVAPVDGTLVFTWDNSFSVFRQKRIRFHLSAGKDATTTTGNGHDDDDDDDDDAHRASEAIVSFDEWFGCGRDALPPELRALRPRRQIMVHTPPPCRTMSKSFPAVVHMADDFPLSVAEFLPVIEVLSKTTSAFQNVQEFFNAHLVEGFPVQFCFPLVPSVSATFCFESMRLGAPAPALFTLPAGYAMYHEDVLSPRTHAEMLQNLTAV